MTAIKTIESMAPELANPGYWIQRRLIYLSAILETRDEDSRIKLASDADTKISNRILTRSLPKLQSKIEQRFSELCENGNTYQFNKIEKQNCNEVLEYLTLQGWRCAFFITQTKIQRPSFTATSPDELALWQLGQQFLKAFWSGELEVTADFKLLAFWLELHSCTALSRAALNRLMNANFDLIFNHAEGILLLPLDTNAIYQLPIRLSARARLLLNNLVQSKQITRDSTQQLMKPNLGTYFSDIQSLKLEELPTQLSTKQITEVLQIASYQAPFNGTEPLLTSVIAREHIPVPIQQENIAQAIYRPRLFRHEPQLEKKEDVTDGDQDDLDVVPSTGASATQTSEYYLHEAIEWQLESRLTIYRIRNKLRQSLITQDGEFRNNTVDAELVWETLAEAKKLTIQNTLEVALTKQLFDYERQQITEQLNKLSNVITSLDLAIECIRWHLIERTNTFDTCFKEINAIFLHGFLAYEAGWNLEQWDEEDFELLTTEHILARDGRATTNESTRYQTVASLNRVIRFARDRFGLFRSIETPKLSPQGRIFTSRNNIVTLQEFDNLIETTGELESAILILAFYAGMRSGEIINLSLNDVANSRHELTVYVRAGKTPSAKRAIPLHRLMPPNLLRKVQAVVELREIDYRNFMRGKRASRNIDQARSNFKMFVKSKIDDHKSGQVILSETIDTLKNRLGRKADLHLLRHSFASWFFLRWYAAKHPDFIESLTNKNHWLFSNDGIVHIKQFLGVFTPGPVPADHANAMIYFIKLFGHANTATLFQVYIHTYEFVLDHALTSSYQHKDAEPLKGKLIAALIPGMKSRASQRTLTDRSAKALLRRTKTKNRST